MAVAGTHREPFQAAANTSAAHPSGVRANIWESARRSRTAPVPIPETIRLHKRLSDEEQFGTAQLASVLQLAVGFIYISVRKHLASPIRTAGAHMEAVEEVSRYRSTKPGHFGPHEETQVSCSGNHPAAALPLILIPVLRRRQRQIKKRETCF